MELQVDEGLGFTGVGGVDGLGRGLGKVGGG